jgi:hypothetical protein
MLWTATIVNGGSGAEADGRAKPDATKEADELAKLQHAHVHGHQQLQRVRHLV